MLKCARFMERSGIAAENLESRFRAAHHRQHGAWVGTEPRHVRHS